MTKPIPITDIEWKDILNNLEGYTGSNAQPIDQFEYLILRALNENRSFELNKPYDLKSVAKGFKNGSIELLRDTSATKIFIGSFHVNKPDGSNKLANVTLYKYESALDKSIGEKKWKFDCKMVLTNDSTYEYPVSKLNTYLLKQLSLDGHQITSKYARVVEGKSEEELITYTDLVEKIRNLEDTEKLDELLEVILKNNFTINTKDIINIGYRKQQLEEFRRLLYEDGYIDQYKSDHDIRKKGYESIWQYFFEKNLWIWGYGLSYVWSTSFDDSNVEKVLAGNTFFKSGKRADGVLATSAEIRNFVIVEIKLPTHPLLDQHSEAYRDECWRISNEVAGGIAQCQKTKYKFLKEVKEKLELTNSVGDPLGETIYSIKPKSFLIVGSLEEFKNEYGVNEEKYSSFELFRDSNSDPEIITFDELFRRAEHIVEQSELGFENIVENDDSFETDEFDPNDLPF